MGHVPECMVDERIYIQRLKAISITLTGHADELVALHNVLAVQALDNLLYGPHMTIHNCFISRSRLGVFNPILAELTAKRSKSMMIEATHLKADSPSNWGSARPARSCSLQETPQNKEPVRQAKELEAHPQTLWPLRAHLFLKHLHHRHFYLPALIL
ncbi:hypothetical protein [Agrobacterium rosae]|uniref:Uncharacterized protein n=1 Tax=Agrobacterium rosae TaxID=1972867 RepID=A0AAW9FSY9_9HYPH|nr:hypothetical protein [Agrobacterium rosae]MDX8305898.1 hypothetical protein [Agrobacterium rosae]